MATKKIKRRKLNVFKVIIFFLLLYLIIEGIIKFSTIPVKNIYVLNNQLLSDQTIIDSGKLTNYPAYFLINTNQIEKNILNQNPFIQSVQVNKKFWLKIEIKITEHEPLFKTTTNTLVLSNKKEIMDVKDVDVPLLINSIHEEFYDYFIEQYSKIDIEIRKKISEIKYIPNDIDKERFFFTMNDGNNIYLTLFKFDEMNSYNHILSTLENKKGILYLDSGNYFEIFK